LLPMTQRGLRVSKFPFRVVCMVFKLINSKKKVNGKKNLIPGYGAKTQTQQYRTSVRPFLFHSCFGEKVPNAVGK